MWYCLGLLAWVRSGVVNLDKNEVRLTRDGLHENRNGQS